MRIGKRLEARVKDAYEQGRAVASETLYAFLLEAARDEGLFLGYDSGVPSGGVARVRIAKHASNDESLFRADGPKCLSLARDWLVAYQSARAPQEHDLDDAALSDWAPPMPIATKLLDVGGKSLSALPPLEEECEKCLGPGCKCEWCHDTGKIPTPAGRIILDFLGRHLKGEVRF